MKLYEINNVINEILINDLVIDDETGEVLFDEESISELEMAREQKIENICLYIKNLKAEAEAIKNERKNLEARQKGLEKKADRLSNYLETFLDGQKFSTSKCAVSFRKSKKVLVDEEKLPAEWFKIKMTPDKDSIKKALKQGNEIEGAILKETLSMSIK